jgi:predicted nucleic acid-binding protein
MRDPDAVPVVYLDTSVYGRPYDDPNVGANRREIRAVASIVEAVGSGAARLVSSYAVQEECARAAPNVRAFEESLRGHAAAIVPPSPEVERLAARLTETAGLKPAESLHVACAALAGAGEFISCNPRRLRKQAAIEAALGHPFVMMSPTDFVREVLA